MNSLKRSFNNLSLTFQSSAGLVIDSNSSASRPFYEGFCNCSYMNTSDLCFKLMKFPQKRAAIKILRFVVDLMTAISIEVIDMFSADASGRNAGDHDLRSDRFTF